MDVIETKVRVLFRVTLKKRAYWWKRRLVLYNGHQTEWAPPPPHTSRWQWIQFLECYVYQICPRQWTFSNIASVINIISGKKRIRVLKVRLGFVFSDGLVRPQTQIASANETGSINQSLYVRQKFLTFLSPLCALNNFQLVDLLRTTQNSSTVFSLTIIDNTKEFLREHWLMFFVPLPLFIPNEIQMESIFRWERKANEYLLCHHRPTFHSPCKRRGNRMDSVMVEWGRKCFRVFPCRYGHTSRYQQSRDRAPNQQVVSLTSLILLP
jgi:hypothetical protein